MGRLGVRRSELVERDILLLSREKRIQPGDEQAMASSSETSGSDKESGPVYNPGLILPGEDEILP